MMTRPIISLCLLLATIVVVDTRGDVNVEVLDPTAGKHRLTYYVNVAKANVTEYVFPTHGLVSTDKNIEVVSVTELNTKQALKYEILPGIDKEQNPVPGRYRVKAHFANPLPEGSVYSLEVTVILYNKENCRIDEDGKWILTYSTGHDVFFVVPKNHAVVFADFPVEITQKMGRIVLSQRSPARRTFTIKTVAIRSSD